MSTLSPNVAVDRRVSNAATGLAQAKKQAVQAHVGPVPKVIPGGISKENEGTLTWGYHHYLAYGCSAFVIVVDTDAEQIVQSLDAHRAVVTALQWCPGSLSHAYPDPATQTTPKLASGDSHGVVIVWDVRNGSAVHTLTDARSQVAKIEWMPNCEDRLAVLYENTSSVILFDTLKGAKIWRWDSSDNIQSLAFDPFNHVHMGLAGQGGWLYFYDNVRKGPAAAADKKLRLQTGGKHDELLDVQFWPHARDVAVFLLSREVMIFDLKVKQGLSSMGLEKHRADFVSVSVSVADPSRIICLHSDGSLSAYVKRSGTSWTFDLQCFGDVLRINKQSKKSKCLGLAVSPLNPSNVATINADGKLWIWHYGKEVPHATESLLSGFNEPIYRFSLRTLLANVNIDLMSQAVSPFSSPSECLMAFGTKAGTVQVVDLVTGSVHCEMAVFDNSVRGVRWVAPTTVAVYSCRELKPGVFKNHLNLLDLQSGATSTIRPSVLENTYIRGIRLSYKCQYLVVLLKDKPFEMWDLVTCTLIRVFHQFPNVTAFTWMSPTETSPYRPPHTSAILNRAPGSAGLAREPAARTKEQFIFITSDSALNHFTIEGETITTNPQTKSDYGSGLIVCVAWKEAILVTADTSGVITVRNFREKTAQQILTHRGVIRSLRFSQMPQDLTIAVLFSEGDYGLYDAISGRTISSSHTTSRSAACATIGLEWSGGNLVTVTKEGHIRILERTDVSKGNSAIPHRSYLRPLSHPALLPPAIQLALRHACVQGQVGSTSTASRGTPVGEDSMVDISAYLAGQAIPPGTLADMLSDDIDGGATGASSGSPSSVRAAASASAGASLIDMDPTATGGATGGGGPSTGAGRARSKTTYFGLSLEEQPVGTLPPSLLAQAFAQTLPPDLVATLSATDKPLQEKALAAAQYFGDIYEVRFWQLCCHYIPLYAQKPPRKPAPSVSLETLRDSGKIRSHSGASTPNASTSAPGATTSGTTDTSTTGAALPSIVTSSSSSSSSSSGSGHPLPSGFDILRHQPECHSEAISRADRHSTEDIPYAQLKSSCATRILLGDHERAIQMLLETPADHENFYQDALKACVVAGALSREQYENTIKIVATYLIANDNLDEGVQFLCLIGKGLDACRYLQSYDKWVDAAHLAKTMLNEEDAAVVHQRWAEHLVKADREVEAIEVFLSLGMFSKVLEILVQRRLIDTAQYLLQALTPHSRLMSEIDDEVATRVQSNYRQQLSLLGHAQDDTPTTTTLPTTTTTTTTTTSTSSGSSTSSSAPVPAPTSPAPPVVSLMDEPAPSPPLRAAPASPSPAPVNLMDAPPSLTTSTTTSGSAGDGDTDAGSTGSPAVLVSPVHDTPAASNTGDLISLGNDDDDDDDDTVTEKTINNDDDVLIKF